MSIAGNMQVMHAKMKGDIKTLMDMAVKGDMAAAVALKEMKDAKDQQAAMMQQAHLSTAAPSGTVLSGLAAQIEDARGPMATTQNPPQAYAEGGEVDLEEQRRGDRASVRSGVDSLKDFLAEYGTKGIASALDIGVLPLRAAAGVADTGIIRPLRAAGADIGYMSDSLTPGTAKTDSMTPFYDTWVRAKEGKETPVAKMPTDDRQKRTAGIYDVKKPPVAKMPNPAGEGTGIAAPGARKAKPSEGTADTPESTAELATEKYITDLQKLSDKGKELTEKERALLDAAHARNTERTKGRGIWDLIDAVAAQRGNSKAIDSLVKGTAAYRASEKQRKEGADTEEASYARSKLLLDKADIAAARGDLEGAYKLRKEAQDTMRKNKLTDAQIDYYSARSDGADAKAEKDRRAGIAGGVGSKPMSDKDIMTAAMRMQAADVKAGVPAQPLQAYVQQVRSSLKPGAPGTMPGTANAAPSGWGPATVK